jgi:hypothetical protein
VGVAVLVLQLGLVHVLMAVLVAVLVGVRMLVRDVVVLVRSVRVRVGHVGMLMFVGVRPVMGVLFGHGVLSNGEAFCVS